MFIARASRRDLQQVCARFVHHLKSGERVAYFPEGTSSAQGRLLPFHAGLFEAAISARVAVQPHALSYRDTAGALHPGAAYIGDMNFAHSVKLILSGRAMVARLESLAPIEVGGMNRRDVAQAAHCAVALALQSVCEVPH